MGVRMRTFGSILRTTSSLIASSTFDRIVEEQMLSSPTFVVGKQNAAATDASMELAGVHGSMSAAVSNVFSPVSTISKAVGRTLTL